MSNLNAPARKIQEIFRKKRVFMNTHLGWKMSRTSLTTKIVSIKTPINFSSIFKHLPKGLSEVMGYKGVAQKPIVRYVPSSGWIGDDDGVTKVVAKKGQQTIVLTPDSVEVLGTGNYEAAFLAIVKNGWAAKSLLRETPTYKKIDGKFAINLDFDLPRFRTELKRLPTTLLEEVKPFTPEIFPALVLKLKKPKLTYQFFANGIVLFTGIKDPADKEVPKQLFKNFFTEYGLDPAKCIHLGEIPKMSLPTRGNAEAKKLKLASRYNYAGRWNALLKPPPGFYIRPGTNNAARFYPYRKMRKNMQSGEVLNLGAMNLSGVAPKVVKAFEDAGIPIPQSTINAFASAGYPLKLGASVAKTGAAHANRRAPSWNATKPGFYVRPGPGQQPYWFAIPTGLASGRKTVITTYTKAGRNIPAAVRAIFKIPANVKTNVIAMGNESFKPGLQHLVTMGLNKILRINNRQATRLTKAELLAIARNMEIPEANAKMNPARLIGLIQKKAGVNKPIRNANVRVNGMYYRLLNNGRVEKTTNQGVQTRRAWATLSATEQNKIAKALLPANLHGEFNTTAKNNKFNTLRAYVAGKKPKSLSPQAVPSPKKATPSPSSAGSNANMLEFEYAARLGSNLGNLSRAGNEAVFMKIYGKLPVGARGKPLKADVDKAYAKFVKEMKKARMNEPSKARFASRIQVPNWMPASKVQAYKNLVTNLSYQKPKPAQKNLKTAIKAWINREVPQSPARAAHDVENAITGEVRHVPARVPRVRTSPVIPKRSPPAKKSPKPKKYNASKSPRLQKEYALPNNRSAITNLENAIINMGLPTGSKNTYTWAGLQRAGLNAKFRNAWLKHVAI